MHFRPTEWHTVLASTSTTLRERLAGEPALPAGTLIAAREQTAGRGRHGHAWISAPGQDLTFSFLIRPQVPAEAMPSLSLAVALGVATGLESMGLAPRVKWPNDVLLNRRKVAGILIEQALSRGPGQTMIVGIGLNVNMGADRAERIQPPATSMRIETGQTVPVDIVLATLLPRLAHWVERWQCAGFAGLHHAWSHRTHPLGTHLTVGHGPACRTGRLAGFGPRGELLLETPDGCIHPIWSDTENLIDAAVRKPEDAS
jgi:BirA family biotin operon repressor/biotin-[acetyl-CoA-carboxylase] ligase